VRAALNASFTSGEAERQDETGTHPSSIVFSLLTVGQETLRL
jgi:hypothetical protein